MLLIQSGAAVIGLPGSPRTGRADVLRRSASDKSPLRILNNTASSLTAAASSAGVGQDRLHHIVGYQLAQAAIVTYGVFEEQVGTPLKLRPVEYTILRLVEENAGVSPAQLSKALAVTRPNISVWVDKLQARGLVRREQNATDRRGQLLHVTGKGAALAAKATRLLIEGERAALSTLSPVEQMMLTELLHKIARARADLASQG